MYDFSNSINKYDELTNINESQNIGLFLNNDVDFNSILYFIYPKDIYNNLSFFMIYPNLRNKFKQDILNDNCFLDSIIIQSDFLELDKDFIKTFIKKCKLLDIKIICDFGQILISLVEFKLDNEYSTIIQYVINNADVLILQDLSLKNEFNKYNNILVFPKKITNDFECKSYDIVNFIEKNKFDNLIETEFHLPIKNFWNELFSVAKRNKNNLLYKFIMDFFKQKVRGSFLNFLISESFNIVEQSQLFDLDFYYNQFKDIKNENPITHYLDNEINNEIKPSIFFHPKDYLENNFLCKYFKINPFVFYCLYKNEQNYFPFISDFNDDEIYKIIDQSNLFDSKWYLNKYPDINASNYQTDPLLHYVEFGYKEKRRNPNNYFSNEFYTKKYLFNNNTLNPLVHYIVWGQNNYFKANISDTSSVLYSKYQANEILMSFEKKISVVLVISNHSFENIINSINSILKINYIKKDFYILLDNICDLKFHSELKEFCIEKNVNIIEMDSNENLFFCLNHFIRNLNTDVFLFNNFIELSDSTLKNLIIKAYSEESIDIVVPISNSILDKEEFSECELPKLTNEGVSTLVNRCSENMDFSLEYIDIFCFYIKENFLLNFDVDEKNCYFNPSKNFFYLKLKNKSNIMLCDSAYVYCNDNFFEEITLNSHIHNAIDFQNFRNYEYLNGFKTLSNNMSDIKHFTTMKDLSHRILYVLKEENLYLFNEFYNVFNKENYEVYFLTFSSNKIILMYDYLKIREWSFDVNSEKNNFNFFNYNKLENIYFSLLSSLDISIIHFDDLIYGSLNLINIANCFNIPVIINCGNYDYICPFSDVDLDRLSLDSDALCSYCKNNLICDKKYFMESYKQESAKLFNQVNLIVFSDNQIKRIFSRFFNGINFEIKSILNPFDINFFELFNTKLPKGIRILVPGCIFHDKLIYDMKHYFGDLIEFHFLGDISDSLKDVGVFHGEFSHDLFISKLNEINPNFIGIFGIFDEIFEILDISKNKKIPLLVEDIEEVYDFIDDLKGVYFVKKDSLNNMSCFFIDSKNKEGYNNLLKELYYSDNGFLENVRKINGFYDELYFNLVQKKQKLIIDPFEYIEKTNVNLSFFDFEEFLSQSYISPLFKSPFTYEDKRCLAFMDHISKMLVENLKKIKNKPLVSILMVVSEYYGVSRSIDSVLSQKYENFELIIINTSQDLILNNILYSYDDNRIKIINVVNDMGLNYYNFGLTYSKGEYIAYMTSYTEWDERYLETMIGAFVELPDAPALYSGQFICDEYSIKGVCFAPFNKSLLRNKNFIDLGSFCHKKEIIQQMGGFENSLKYYNEWDFILKISDYFRIYSIPIVFSKFYYYSKFRDFSLVNSNYIKLIQERSIKRAVINEFELHHKVNIVIPSFESLNDLQECIESILSFNLNDMVNIIVVDNNSNIAVKKYLKNLECNGQIKLILNDENYGFTYAINQGISISDKSADILLLNNDAILTKGAIESMQWCAYEFNDAAIVVPQEVRAGGSSHLRGHVPFANSLVDCDVTPSIVSKNIINVPLFNHGEILELNFAPFFCTYIKREVLNDSLGLDAELGRHYRSDRIFSNYVRHIMNLKIYYVQNAIVFHKSQQSTKKLKKNKTDNNDSFNIMVSKNQWEPHLAKKLGYNKPLWDD